MRNNKQSSVTQLIEEIQRRVAIIQSEPQTMARELMIDNLTIDLEQYESLHKEEAIDFYIKGCEDTYGMDEGHNDSKDAEDYYNKLFKSE